MRTGALLVAWCWTRTTQRCGASVPSPRVHGHTVACQYVFQTYSGLFQRPLKGFRPSAFSEKAAGATSPVLRKELAYWKAAEAYANWAGTVEAGTDMVNTCDHLGFSSLD